MAAIALLPKLWLPQFEPWRLLRPLKLEGQFFPRQGIQFSDGVMPANIGVGGGGFLTLSYQTHTEANAETITAPASINAGDVLILWDFAIDFSSPPTDVVPTGFTGIGTTTGPENRARVSYKIADGDEDSSTITGMAGTFAVYKILAQYRADFAVSALVSAGYVGTSTNSNPSQQTLTASSGTVPVHGFTAFASDLTGTIDPRTTSITPDREIGHTSNKLYIHEYVQASSPANYTWDMDDEGYWNTLFGFYIHEVEA